MSAAAMACIRTTCLVVLAALKTENAVLQQGIEKKYLPVQRYQPLLLGTCPGLRGCCLLHFVLTHWKTHMSLFQVTVGDYVSCNNTGFVAYVFLHAEMPALKCYTFLHQVVARSPYAAQDAWNMQP